MYAPARLVVSRRSTPKALIASIAEELAARATDDRERAQASEIPAILRLASKYGLLDGIDRAHIFDLECGEGVGLALTGYGLSPTQNTYSPEGPTLDDPCSPWILGNLSLVFIDLDRHDHVAWLLAMADCQAARHTRAAVMARAA